MRSKNHSEAELERSLAWRKNQEKEEGKPKAKPGQKQWTLRRIKCAVKCLSDLRRVDARSVVFQQYAHE